MPWPRGGWRQQRRCAVEQFCEYLALFKKQICQTKEVAQVQQTEESKYQYEILVQIWFGLTKSKQKNPKKPHQK